MKLNEFHTKWCPAARVVQMGSDRHGNATLLPGGSVAFNRMGADDGQTKVPGAAMCIGLSCPLFLQHGAVPDEFWCALGREPSRFPQFVDAPPITPPAAAPARTIDGTAEPVADNG